MASTGAPPAVTGRRRRRNWQLGAAVVIAAVVAVVGLGMDRRGTVPQPPVPTSGDTPAPAPGTATPEPTDTQLDPPAMVGTIRVGERPVQIALDVPAGLAFTANSQGGDLSVIDLEAGVVLYSLEVPGRPSAVATDGDGQLYVADGEGTRVHALDLTSGERIASWKVGRHPAALAVDPDRGVLYVAVGDGVTLLDTDSGAEVGRIATGRAADLVVDGSHQLWVLAGGEVARFDPLTGNRTAIVPTGTGVTGLDVDADRNRLYLAGGGLSAIDLGVRETVDLSGEPGALAVRVDSHNQLAYLVDPEANLVIALTVG